MEKMRQTLIILISVSLGLHFLSDRVNAATGGSHSKKSLPEVYSAIEDPPEIEEPHKPQPAKKFLKPINSKGEKPGIAVGRKSELTSLIPAIEIRLKKLENELSKIRKSEPEKFDVVPVEQVEVFSERIRLVDLILRKTRHAYDYRTNTLKELNDVWARLNLPKDNHQSKSPSEEPKLAPNQAPPILEDEFDDPSSDDSEPFSSDGFQLDSGKGT